MNVQAKSGYVRSRPKYDKLYEETATQLRRYFPKDDPIHNRPFVLVHKLDGRKAHNIQWTFAQKDIVPILKDYYILKNLYDMKILSSDELLKRFNRALELLELAAGEIAVLDAEVESLNAELHDTEPEVKLAEHNDTYKSIINYLNQLKNEQN